MIRRIAFGLVGLALGALAVLSLREATLSTHQPVPPDSRTEVVVDVDTRHRERGQTPTELIEALLLSCRLEVSSDYVDGVEQIGESRYRAVLNPALDQTNRRQYRGCVEDWTLDQVQADVIRLEDLPLP